MTETAVLDSREEIKMAGKYDNLAKTIVENVGGVGNVAALTHCVTRLRFNLKDESKANKEKLTGTDGVITVIQSGGQYQVVVGNKVTDVYEAILNNFDIAGDKQKEQKGQRSGNPRNNLSDMRSWRTSDVFDTYSNS